MLRGATKRQPLGGNPPCEQGSRSGFQWRLLAVRGVALHGIALLPGVLSCSSYYDESASGDVEITGSYLDPSPSATSSMGPESATDAMMPPIGPPPDTTLPPVGVSGSPPEFQVTLAPDDMVRDFVSEQDLAPCDDPLFDSHLSVEPSAGAPVLHVSVEAIRDFGEATTAAAGGRETPLATIGDALAGAVPGTTVLVALGTYDEAIRIPSGVLVIGGLDPATWEPTTSQSIVTNGVTFQSTPAAGVDSEPAGTSASIAGLLGFDVRRGVYAAAGSRVLLRDNVVSVDAETWPRNGSRRGGVEADDAVLRAEGNTVVYSVDPVPDHAFDSGFIQTGGCALIARNRVIDFKTSFRVKDAQASTIVHNVAEGSYNGVWLENADATVAANAFYYVPPAQGCVYAMYLRLDSNPKIRNNQFFLSWLNNRGINEECVGCDPQELWGNAFHTHSPDSILYLDRTSEALESASLDSLTDVDRVNGLGDIAVIGDNTIHPYP